MTSTGENNELELTPAEVHELIERFRTAVKRNNVELLEYSVRYMPDVEEAAKRAYTTFSRTRYGTDGVGWDVLSDPEREAWRAVVEAVIG